MIPWMIVSLKRSISPDKFIIWVKRSKQDSGPVWHIDGADVQSLMRHFQVKFPEQLSHQTFQSQSKSGRGAINSLLSQDEA